jgi:HK97 family phage portal protein
MKKEKRSLFKMIFGNKKQKIIEQTLQLLSGFNATYTDISDNVKDNIIAKECINAISTHCAKMMPKHYQRDKQLKTAINGDINYIISCKPNPFMTVYQFLYKTTALWLSQNNEFIYIDIDNMGYLRGLYPLNPLFCTLIEYENEIWLKFQFLNGNIYYIKYSRIIHLRDYYIDHDFYGDTNDVLLSAIETQTVADDGIKNAIKISTSLRGTLKAPNAMLKSSDIQEMRNSFIDDLLKSTSGVAGLDSRLDFKEINLNPVLLNKEQLEMVNGNIYGYFMISEKIIKSEYTPDEWNAFYESVLEPRAIQMGQAFTNAIFGDKAIKEGHCIEFSVNRIKYAKTETKISLIKEAGSLGLLTVDEGREILDLPAIGGEEGSKRLQTLNVINANLADKYQGGTTDGKEGTSNEGI